MNRRVKFLCMVLMVLSTSIAITVQGSWTLEDRENDEFPGRCVDIRQDGQIVARLIYGEGQYKPYLAVYGSEGERLTNPGMDANGEFAGRFPHHRGIFIGWNHIDSDLGRDDLWHLRSGEHMKLVSIDLAEGGDHGARLQATIHWLSSEKDSEGDNLLLVEQRLFNITREDGRTTIDTASVLRAARDLRLGGDLQHAGIHFRADKSVDDRRRETSYLWEPEDVHDHGGRLVSDKMKWVNFLFPIGDRWYSVTQINPPVNSVEELSWRDYGRFGFFFTATLEAGEMISPVYRFIVEEAEAPEDGFKRSAAQQAAVREAAEAYYRATAARFPETP